MIGLCKSSSPANNKTVHRAMLSEFSYGENYGVMMQMFATITMYAFNCPLITPFGRPTPQENLGKPETRGQTVSLKVVGLLYIILFKLTEI